MPHTDAGLDSLTTELRPRGTAPFPWLLVGLIMAALAVLYAGGWLTISGRLTAEERQARASQELARHNNEIGDFADAARVKTVWTAARAGVTKFLVEQAQLAKTLAELNTLLVELTSSEDGRRIAADPEAVAMFVAVRDKKRPTTEEVELIKTVSLPLGEACDRALAGAAVVEPPAAFQARHREIEQTLAQAAGVAQDLALLRTLIEKTKNNAPADVTLAQAVEAWEQQRNEGQLADLAAAQELLHSEMAQRHQVTTLETERREAEAKLKSDAADQSVRAMLAEAQSEKEQEIVQLAKEQLAAVRARYQLERDYQAALPEIRSLLSPMISKSKMQLGGDPFGWTQGEEGPLSLAQIKRFGALQPNKETLLATLFCGPSTGNDRPFGTFPERVPYNDGKFKRAQDLLIKFGDLMVEHGLLNP